MTYLKANNNNKLSGNMKQTHELNFEMPAQPGSDSIIKHTSIH